MCSQAVSRVLCDRELTTTGFLRSCVPLMLRVLGWACSDACASGTTSTYVDMYNATSGSWTKFPAGLGQARYGLAAASLPSGLVFFAGGSDGNETGVCVLLCDRELTTAVLLHCCLPLMLRVFVLTVALTCTLDNGVRSTYVDMYNATSNSWTKFPTGLGQARFRCAAASLPSGLVFVAGGESGNRTGVCVRQLCCVSLCGRELTTTFLLRCCVPLMLLVCVCVKSCADEYACASDSGYSTYMDMYNATRNSWTKFPAGLGQARAWLAAASLPSGLVFFAGGLSSSGHSAYVDMYNSTSNRWTTFPSGLGEARHALAAASLPSGLVFFAGGVSYDLCTETIFCVRQLCCVSLCGRELTTTVFLRCCVDAACARWGLR